MDVVEIVAVSIKKVDDLLALPYHWRWDRGQPCLVFATLRKITARFLFEFFRVVYSRLWKTCKPL